jgi:hypothetical protein
MSIRHLTALLAATVLVGVALLAGSCDGSDDGTDKAGQRATLVRNGPYYEITGDGDDFGNYFETYRVPTPTGEVYCIVYSDKIGESGGGAGLDCDWEGARR